MDYSSFSSILETTGALSGVILYAIAGIAALLVILIIVWLLFKLSAFIKRKQGYSTMNQEITDEEELFGD